VKKFICSAFVLLFSTAIMADGFSSVAIYHDEEVSFNVYMGKLDWDLSDQLYVVVAPTQGGYNGLFAVHIKDIYSCNTDSTLTVESENWVPKKNSVNPLESKYIYFAFNCFCKLKSPQFADTYIKYNMSIGKYTWTVDLICRNNELVWEREEEEKNSTSNWFN